MPRRARPALRAEGPVCLAHRGGAGLWPENTLLAFRESSASGCEVIETDVRLTRDGELVLCHDEAVDRTTDGTGLVADLTLVELKRLDAGYRFTRDGHAFPFRGHGLTIPTLAEALAMEPRLRFNVDMKPRNPGIVGRLVDFVELERVHDRLIVAAEQEGAMKSFRNATNGRVATAAAYGEAWRFWTAVQVGLSHRLELPFDVLEVPPTYGLVSVIDDRFVEQAHASGVKVYAFTINAPREMRRLLNLGVDGLISDRPDRLVPVVERHAEIEREAQDPMPLSQR